MFRIAILTLLNTDIDAIELRKGFWTVNGTSAVNSIVVAPNANVDLKLGAGIDQSYFYGNANLILALQDQP